MLDREPELIHSPQSLPGSLVIHSVCLSRMLALLGTGAVPRKFLNVQRSGNWEMHSKRRELHQQKQESLEMEVFGEKRPERLKLGACTQEGRKWEVLYFPDFICPERCQVESGKTAKGSDLAALNSGPVLWVCASRGLI